MSLSVLFMSNIILTPIHMRYTFFWNLWASDWKEMIQKGQQGIRSLSILVKECCACSKKCNFSMHFISFSFCFSLLDLLTIADFFFFLEILVTSYIKFIYYTCGWKTWIWLVKCSTLQSIQCPWQPISASFSHSLFLHT